MLLTSPRRVTLAPGKGQTIRVRAVPGQDLSEAEYRTHLTVTTVPPRDLGYSAEQAAEARPEELKFLVSSVFGLSIPVIVRLNDIDVAAKIENPRLGMTTATADARATPQVTLDLVRTGAHSLFGNLEVRATKGRSGEVIGVARGVGVYTEIDRRAVQIPLTRAPAKGEQIEIRFSDDDTAPGRLLAAGPLVTP
jgi:P pilus assembly chaperone PapD